MRTWLRLVTVLTVALVAVSACGLGDSGVEPPAAGSGSGPTDPRASLGSPTIPPDPSGAEVTLTGRVVTGAERGCVILRTDATAYVLLGLAQAVWPDADVVVTGRVRPDLQTACQGGEPFLVSRVLSSSGGVDPAT